MWLGFGKVVCGVLAGTQVNCLKNVVWCLIQQEFFLFDVGQRLSF